MSAILWTTAVWTLACASPLIGFPPVAGNGLEVTAAEYGSVALLTRAGAECTAELRFTAATLGDAPPELLPPQVAGTDGTVRWSYPAPRIPNGPGSVTATCRDGAATATASGTFRIERGPIVASALTVRVTSEAPRKEPASPVAALVPLRDAVAERLQATLSAEWQKATRGLGGLQVVDRSADITIFVAAARGTSVNRQSGDGSADVVLYVEDELGKKTVENAVSTALHELGHIWCCQGPDADGHGHWKVKLRDPGLYGVDKFGLMTDPVTCIAFSSLVSCPTRFSDREMRAIGFATFPPPAPDPCVARWLALSAQIAGLDAGLATGRAQIDAANATLADLKAQIRAIEARYGSTLPPSVYATYQSLITQFNTLTQQTNATVSQYNGLIEQRRAVVEQSNALPCDGS